MCAMSKKIRWGVLSTANIGVKKVLPAMQLGQFSSVDAIASRNIENARAAAASLRIPKAYGSMKNSSPTPRSTPSTTRSPTSFTFLGPSRPPKPASMSSVKSPSP